MLAPPTSSRSLSNRLHNPLGERTSLPPYLYDSCTYTDERGVSMHRVTVEEAARRLGIEKESVRKRVYRGQLRSDKEPDGTLRVYLDSMDNVQGQSKDDVHGHEPSGVKDELLASFQDQIEYLRRESERKDAIIMQMAQANATLAGRVPELEAPQVHEDRLQEPIEDSVEGEEDSEPERKPWWQRVFGR